MANTIKIDRKSTRVVAHRGLSGIERENTNAAFVAAGNRSYWGIETDIHVAADGVFVVFHDDNLQRLAGVDKVVEETQYNELKEVTFTDKIDGEERTDLRMPTLGEYIRICKKYDKIAVLELKNRIETVDIERVVKEISELDYLDKTVFISFCYENLSDIKNIDSTLKAQYLTGEWDDALVKKLSDEKMGLDIYFAKLTKERVDLLHSAGVEVNVWTVDEASEAEKLIEYGVDYITTNILE